jgi:hypothetical protein
LYDRTAHPERSFSSSEMMALGIIAACHVAFLPQFLALFL